MKRSLPFLLLCAVGMVIYGHTLQVPFYLDDTLNIAQNDLVKDLGRAWQGLLARRGLSLLTFAVNYRFGGENLAGYHLVNIAIHLAAACVTLLLLRRVFPLRPGLALCGALVFVAHPLQTQGVTYLVQRMTSLSALLFLLALYLYVLGREQLAAGADLYASRHLWCYGGALLAGGLAILAKENAVVLPLGLLLFAWFFPPAGARQRWRPLLVYTAPFALLPLLAAGVYLLWPLAVGTKLDTVGYSGLLRNMEGNSPLHYLATQCSVLWIYIRMLFLPYGQALDHGYPISRELLTWQSLVGGSGLLLLLALAWRCRDRQPAVAAAICWFFLTLAVESSLIPLDPLFEHRLYLPMLGFAMLVPALLARLPRPAWQGGAAVAVILLLSLLTWRRNALWTDPVALYEDNLRVTPHNERAWFNLGQEYLNVNRAEAGERALRESITLNPRVSYGYLVLKELYVGQGRMEEAIAMLHYGVEHVAENGLLYNELALLYGKQGDFDRAVAMSQRAVAASPDIAVAYYNLALMQSMRGEPELAVMNLRKALALDSRHVEARELLQTLTGAGDGTAVPTAVPPGKGN